MRKKEDLKNATGVDASSFAKKTDLANLTSDVDKFDIDRLKNLPNNLSNLNVKQMNQIFQNQKLLQLT